MGKVKHCGHSIVLWGLEREAGEARKKGCECRDARRWRGQQCRKVRAVGSFGLSGRGTESTWGDFPGILGLLMVPGGRVNLSATKEEAGIPAWRTRGVVGSLGPGGK